MEKPLFSIITVTYNAGETLPPTLKSIEEQTYTGGVEFILMDGGSRDNTVYLAAQSTIKNKVIVSEKDKGIYDAMNKAQDIATGEYLIFLNAGDSFHSDDILERIASLIAENHYPGIVYGQTDIVDEHRRRIGSRHLTAPEVLTYRSFADGMLVCHQAMAVLKNLTSPYDLRYKFSADFDWAVRCLQHSRNNVMLSGIMIDYLAEGTTTRNHFKSLTERFRIMSHYYGIIPTIARHFKFALRGIRHKIRL
ncbi:MAG: glycosyltransferase [Paramuribaculum sp.]|nr:glycosyltransferase [Paramuribaculum sp.]